MSGRSQLPLLLGVTAAGGVGYYLYSAGGSPKAAEKKFESDAHKAAAAIKGNVPGNSPNAEAELKNLGAEAGAKIDKVWSEADKQAGRAKSNAEAYAKEARAEAIKSVNKFDEKVEEGAAKAKSGISSWFGGSK